MTKSENQRDTERRPAETLRIRLFGPLEVRVDNESRSLHSKKAGAILALLLLRGGREVQREWLAETLWADGVGGEGLVNLRQRLADLRRELGPASSRLDAPTARSLRFEASLKEVDLLEFDAAFKRGSSESLERAIELYTGPLLEDYSEAWVVSEREERQERFLGALESLANRAFADGCADKAAEWLQRGVHVDLFRQSLHRLLMRALVQKGDRASALQVYLDLRRALLSEASIEPDRETTALFHEIRAETPRPQRHLLSLDERPCRVPYSITPLIGREPEMRDLSARLLTARCVTLTGVGGCGKTRIAQEVGHESVQALVDAAFFVDLASIADPAEIAPAVTDALELPADVAVPRDVQLVDFFYLRHALLILDNCEHLIDGVRELVRTLLNRCPHLRILATSRQPLQLIGESVVPLAPLRCAPETGHTGEPVEESPAARLFVNRARAARADLEPDSERSAVVARICRLMDGLPLGLEIAASLASVLTLEEIADLLSEPGNRLPLRAEQLDLPQRHTSIQTVLDASLARLSDDERSLFMRASVFAGSWTLDAAALLIADGNWPPEPIDNVPSVRGFHERRLSAFTGSHTTALKATHGLVAKSLVVALNRHGGTRYHMLEVVREYAAHRLEESARVEEVRARHQSIYARLAADAEAELTGPQQAEWLATLQEEQPNLRAAMGFGLRAARPNAASMHKSSTDADIAGDQLAVALRTADALGRFWQIRGYFTEGLETIERLLDATSASGETSARADAMAWAALFSAYQGSYQVAQQYAASACAAWKRLGDPRGLAGALGVTAVVAKDTGALEEARSLFEASLELSQKCGDRIVEASATGYLGIIAQNLGDWKEADRRYRAGLEIRREIKDHWGVAASVNNLAILARDRGDSTAARALLEECISVRRALGDRRNLAVSLNVLGSILADSGENEAAEACFRESLRICRDLGDRRSIAYSLEHYADMAVRSKLWSRAFSLYGAADRLRKAIGAPLTPDMAAEREALEARIRMELEALGLPEAASPDTYEALESLLDELSSATAH